MHELSIALSIIEGVEEQLARHPHCSAGTVHLRVGPLSGVVKEALLFSYDIACEGTRLQGSKLVIEDTRIVLFCPTCGEERPGVSPQQLSCSVCHMPSADIRSGAELEVIAFELIEEHAACDTAETS